MGYVDFIYYRDTYKGSAIPETAFFKWERKAENKVNLHTFNRIIESAGYMNDVKMCVCEVAEELYKPELAKDSTGMVLKSYSNDGESGTYADESLSEKSINNKVYDIINESLWHTGLLYRGCY